MMHCNGKCQLYRQLKKAADEEAENNKLPLGVLKLKTSDIFVVESFIWIHSDQTRCHRSTQNSYELCNLCEGYVTKLYQPPQA